MILAIPFPDVSPVLIEIPLGFITLPIRWYALAYIFGFVIGYWLIRRAIDRAHLWKDDTAPLDRTQLEDLLTWMVGGVILGGRMGYVLFYSEGQFLEDPMAILRVWEGGMSFHGGFLGVILAGALFARRNSVPPAKLADSLAIAAPVGLLLGRIANFINAELWGRPTDAPWGVIFPGGAAQDCPNVEGPCARHPSQLYEAGLEGLLLGLVILYLAFARGWLKTPGALTGLFIAGYGAARFFVELFRQADPQFITPDNPMGYVLNVGAFGLSMGQILSLPMILIGLALLIRARRARI
jgi:phosphatidylglycerol:prolipoprotein diacylglycerol transferase